MTTEKCGFTELAANQAQPHIPINTTIRRQDALVQPTAIDFVTAPPGSNNDGDVYIVAENATGLFSNQDGKAAYLIAAGNTWIFVTPRVGWKFYVEATGSDWRFEGGSPGGWAELADGAGGGGSSTLAALTDVDTSGAANGNVLTYNSGSGKWVPGAGTGGGGASTLNDLTDVAIGSPGPADGDLIKYDASIGAFTNQADTGLGAVSLNDLSDVALGSPGPADGDTLVYSDALKMFVNQAPAGGGGGSSYNAVYASIGSGGVSDFNPSGWSGTVTDLFLNNTTGGFNALLNGIVRTNGQAFRLHNVALTTDPQPSLILQHNSGTNGGGSAGNGFLTPGQTSYTIGSGKGCWVVSDDTNSRWRIVGSG